MTLKGGTQTEASDSATEDWDRIVTLCIYFATCLAVSRQNCCTTMAGTYVRDTEMHRL
jgi:hypothetical protein